MASSSLLSYLEFYGKALAAPSSKIKLAERIAGLIEDRIVVEAWPVGYPLGREADLAAAAQVSRWSLREAIALLEQIGMVESRRGRNGGLYVASTLFDAVRTGLSNYLEFLGPSPAQIRAARRALESLLLKQAARHLDEHARQRLTVQLAAVGNSFGSEMLAATAQLRSTLIDLSANPALSLFIHAMGQTLIHACWYSTLDDVAFRKLMHAMSRSTCSTVEALLDGDLLRAQEWEDEFLEHFEHVFQHSAMITLASTREGALERVDTLFPISRPPKKAEHIARSLRQQILEAGWPVGLVLGSEADLMTRFKVGRAVIREAIRSLERLGVVEMGRGGASGLRVVQPDPAQMIGACSRYLRRASLSVDDRADIREALLKPELATDNPIAQILLKVLEQL
ncbi:FadR/GntR family transcriptional regulator [Pseudomonas bharatica]|uniref:FadR/GntR family transcriptional regulator n=1 Tax=Pseudomonas bharatica TaxID=2692112 RepID=UPI003B27E05A